MAESTPFAAPRPLLSEAFAWLAAHRPACGQERTHQRGVALVLGWLSAIGRHSTTRVLHALGLGDAERTAWYRLFCRRHADVTRLATYPRSSRTCSYSAAGR